MSADWRSKEGGVFFVKSPGEIEIKLPVGIARSPKFSPMPSPRLGVKDLHGFRRHLGGTRDVKRILISNNGLAAVKGIRSIREWCHDHIGDSEAIEICAMASPDDLQSHAAFTRMADRLVEVPGGPSSANYGNVEVITRAAVQSGCDAVYPGWGHASENPALPAELDKARIAFLGPSSDAMFLLGSKIASTILAQSIGVPCVPWSGSEIKINPQTLSVSASLEEAACVTTLQECLEVCEKVGFPAMLKASEGGGGKGIRRVKDSSQVEDMFRAVTDEVKNCHVFVMRMLEDVRHVEVQVIADRYGAAISAFSRDCSVQRRHQKIIEEGPPIVDAATLRAMENEAVNLAKAVRYVGLGTVEFLFHVPTGQHYFLEVNPRIQVEHPVSELITGLNLPAALLCVAGLNLPLASIPEVREMYGEKPISPAPIDFAIRLPHPPRCHAIAVRITSEGMIDATGELTPTIGIVEEISFPFSKQVWGYFSVSPGGAIHQYMDCQFGHLFATGATRESARAAMVLALRGLQIRGEIRHNGAILQELLETMEFRESKVTTGWLDARLAQGEGETKKKELYPALVAAAVHRVKRMRRENFNKYSMFLKAGHVPSRDLLCSTLSMKFVYRSEKYELCAGIVDPQRYAVTLNDSTLVAIVRDTPAGGMLLTFGGRTYSAYGEEESNALRITMNGKPFTFSDDVDPTQQRSSISGRLVRFLLPDGAHVNEGAPFAEVESMKMLLQLRSSISGKISLRAAPGSTLVPGKVLAKVEPDDLSTLRTIAKSTLPWPAAYLAEDSVAPSMLLKVRESIETLWNLINGYHFPSKSVRDIVGEALNTLPSLSLSEITLESLNLSFLPPLPKGDPNTPNAKMKVVFSTLVMEYLKVENLFDDVPREDAIFIIRDRPDEPGLELVYAIDFAHHGSHREQVMMAILQYLETNYHLLRSCEDLLHEVLKLLKGVETHGQILVQSRLLLRTCMMPSFESRKDELVRRLETTGCTDVGDTNASLDLVASLMFDQRCSHLLPVAVEMILRGVHRGIHQVSGISVSRSTGFWHGKWKFSAVRNLEIISPFTTSKPPDHSRTPSDEIRSISRTAEEGNGFFVVFHDEMEMTQGFAQFLESLERQQMHAGIVYVFVSMRPGLPQKEMSKKFEAIVETHEEELSESEVSYVTFIAHGAKDGPNLFTFSTRLNFTEDTVLRNEFPVHAERLELWRLSLYDVATIPVEQYRSTHVYAATPRRPVGKSTPAQRALDLRLFVRSAFTADELDVPRESEVTRSIGARMIQRQIASLEVARGSDKKYAMTSMNHLFAHLIDFTVNLSGLYDMAHHLASMHGEQLKALGVQELELKFTAATQEGGVPYRVFVRNYTGFDFKIECYIEVVEDGKTILQRATFSTDLEELLLPSTPRHELLNDSYSNLPDSRSQDSLEYNSLRRSASQRTIERVKSMLPSPAQSPSRSGSIPTTAAREERGRGNKELVYPLPSQVHLKRCVAQAQSTTFVCDWMLLFDLKLRKQWHNFLVAHSLERDVAPSPLWDQDQYHLTLTGELVPGKPPSTREECGMIMWLCRYHPPELSGHSTSQRRLVVVANDITYQVGSFSIREDTLFTRASEFARQQGIPFIYISCNSGARIGFIDAVKKRFRVARSGDAVDYLYLTEKDYTELNKDITVVNCMKMPVVEGEKDPRYKILDIIGAPGDNIGVENLQGSGLICGQMSLNYETIPTLSIVTGRTVGVGAYLVRLGRRVIQTRKSPIILTGAPALNRLLGKEVYTSNNQLGGNQIMQPNGVTHWEAKGDSEAAEIALRWLQYIPTTVSREERAVPQPIQLMRDDPIDREVTFCPKREEAYDPRFLITGDPATGTLGLFDQDSWMETMRDWAKSVVAGRATLGGIPCGIVAVETRVTKKVTPADPADPSSTSIFTTQAGQVWFPDSAYKTASALEDFRREQLPCFVFANWRGFSGGTRDMFDEVLKFGSMIVDQMRQYDSPLFIYMPPHGELRGGSWVVLDPLINHCGCVEMYCDELSKAGILEPSGICEIKFRAPDVDALMCRNEEKLAALRECDPEAAKDLARSLQAAYHDATIRFAELHDTPGRMKAMNVISDIIPWRDSRRIFHKKVLRKFTEIHHVSRIISAQPASTMEGGFATLREWFCASRPDPKDAAKDWRNDDEVVRWMASEAIETRHQQTKLSLDVECAKSKLSAILRSAPEEDVWSIFQSIIQHDPRLAQYAKEKGLPSLEKH